MYRRSPAPALRRVSTLVELLSLRAGEESGRKAYTFLVDGKLQEEHAAYGELDRRARAVAARLQALGARGERALLLYPPGLEYVRALLACFYAGVIAVPVYPPRRNKPTPRLESILADCRPTLALTTPGLAAEAARLTELMPELARVRWLATEAVEDAAAGGWRDPRVHGDDVAFLQYTSGSTAAPKGVMVSHANLLHNFRVIEALTGYTPEDRSVIWLPPYHDMGLIGGILQPMYTGYWAALMAPAAFVQRPARWLEAVTRYRATTSGGPNFAYDLCVHSVTPEDRERLDLSSWKLAFNGAEPVRHETLEAFTRTFGPQGFRREAFYPCYGLAEGTLMVTGSRTPEAPPVLAVDADALAGHRVAPAEEGRGATRLVGCGRVAPEQEVRIVDSATLRECAADRVGEIWVRGSSVAQGYWERAEETARTFGARLAESGDGPFLRTGDLGFLAEGELYVTGRVKDLVIVRGRNHYPHDIEQTAARAHPALRPGGSAAFGTEHAGEERLVVVQEVGRHCTAADLEEIAAAVRAAVAEEHELQVHAVALVKSGGVPKTSSGKVQRLGCRADFLAGALPVLGVSTLEAAPDDTGLVGPGLSREALEGAAPAERRARISHWLRGLAARALRVPVERLQGRSLAELGLDSVRAVSLAAEVEQALGVRLSPASLLEEGGIEPLAEMLLSALVRESERMDEGAAPPPSAAGLLLPAQERIWFLHHLQPDGSAYNLPLALRIRGALDVAFLEAALAELARRHEVLRAVFPVVEGRPVQQVRAEMPVALPFEDLSGFPPAQRNAAAARIAREEAAAPFDLATGPLLRVRLLRLSADEHLLVWVLHHIVGDGISAGVMLRDLAALYTAAHAGAEPQLPPLPTRHSDLAFAHREWLRSPAALAQLAWWREHLRDLPVLDLPTDRPRPLVQSFRGAAHRFDVPSGVASALRALAAGEGATLFMSLLAAFQLLMARRSGEYDVTVGVPVSVRSDRAAGLVGPLVNTVALRTDIDPGEGFRALLLRVRREALEAYARQDCPFERVVEAVQPGRDLSGNPLFQTMLAFQGAPLDPVEVPGATFIPEPLHGGGSILDLTLYVWERADDSLAASLEYATDLFDRDTGERTTAHFVELLRSAVAQPERAVGELEMLPAAERRHLLREWNRSGPAGAVGSLHELFSVQAARTPGAPALRCHGSTSTYAELERESNRIAHHLHALGVGPEARVGVCLGRSSRLVAALLGVLKAGGAYVPLDPAYPAERLGYMLHDAGAELVLTDARCADRIPAGMRSVVLDREHAALAACPAEPPTGEVAPGGLAYVLYTSGSTGRPKGVLVEHRSAVAVVHFLREVVRPEDRSAVLFSTSVSFDVSVGEIFGTLCWGGTLILVEHALELPRVSDEGVRVVVTVPSAAAELLRAGGIPESVRQLNLAGEVLPAWLVRELYARGHVERVLNLYGPTEDTVYSTWCEVDRGAGRVGIGRPIPGSRAYVLDAAGAPAPVGVPGELCLAGAGLARGYQAQPGLTAERFLPDPFAEELGARMYRTGDRARWLTTGELEYLGRVDAQVKVRGFRIEPGEVEAVLRAHSAVSEAVVASRDEGWLVAWLVPVEGAEVPEAGALRGWLRERLPDYMVPSAFVRLEALPRTPSGKVDRRALPDPEIEGAEARGGHVAPRTPTEEVLAVIWADVLGGERVGAHDDFFALGGHSLMAIRLVDHLRAVMGVELPLRTLFDHPTLEGLAARADEARHTAMGATRPPLVPLPRADELPLSFAQERLWFLERLRPGGAAYVMPAALRLRGVLDAPALRRSLDEVVRRHEVLRSRFPGVQGRPVQVVDEPRPLRWWEADVSLLSGEAREAELRRLAVEEAARPFDLEADAPLRPGLVRLADDDHVLLLTLHHIVCDGWSFGVLAREISALYAAFARGREPQLPVLAVQYADYVLWQRAHLSGDGLRAELVWWRERLTGLDAPVELPTDRPRPEVRSFSGAYLSTRLGPELSAGVRGLAGAEHATPFMVLLASWNAVLHHHLRSNRVVVGTDVAGRASAEVARLMGLFVNQLVLATDLSGNPGFRELLGRVRETTLGAYAHAEVPFNLLVDTLNPVRDPARNPLFQVMFVLDNTPAPELRLPGLEVEVMELHLAGAPFDVSVLLSERAGEFHCLWRYDPDLFDESTVARLTEHFTGAVAGVVADPDLRLDAIGARLDEADRARRGAELDRLREASALRFRRIASSRAGAEQEPVA
ncbi:MAG TPA: amino acid adenylation domain-containing protein [Longimicrobiaceae bacterium]|nr:amino acid adenylation domain-containing protein [Longimicrobiaceae bacterium]